MRIDGQCSAGGSYIHEAVPLPKGPVVHRSERREPRFTMQMVVPNPEAEFSRETIERALAKPSRPPSPAFKPMSKTCANPECGKTFERQRGERADHFGLRRGCSKSCSQKISIARRRQLDHGDEELLDESKDCEVCGTTFRRRKRDRKQVWTKRKTCSLSCAGKLAAQERVARAAS